MTTATEPRTFRSKKQRRQQVQYLAKTVQPLGIWGEGPGRGHKAPKTRRKTRALGTGSQKYLMQRIARDYPDVLERAKKGEFLSVRAAAIAAGILQPNPQVRFKQIGTNEWRVHRGRKTLGYIRCDHDGRFAVWLPGAAGQFERQNDFASLEDAMVWCREHLATEEQHDGR